MLGSLRIICLFENATALCECIYSFVPYENSSNKNKPKISPYWKNDAYSVIETQFEFEKLDKEELIKHTTSFFWKGKIDEISESEGSIELSRYATEHDMMCDPEAFFCVIYVSNESVHPGVMG